MNSPSYYPRHLNTLSSSVTSHFETPATKNHHLHESQTKPLAVRSNHPYHLRCPRLHWHNPSRMARMSRRLGRAWGGFRIANRRGSGLRRTCRVWESDGG
jgi:hypothetical protein